MAINLSDYEKAAINQEAGRHETDSIWQVGGLIGFVRTVIQRSIEWVILKWVFVAVGGLLIAFLGKDVEFDKLDRASSDMASGWYFSSVSFFVELFDNKNTAFNVHPVYRSEGIKGLEKKYGLDYKKLFWFVKYDGKEYLLMREPVKNKDGTKKELELDRFIGFEDAENVCSDLGGAVPTHNLVFKSNKLLDRIKAPKAGEMFSDSDEEKGPFRCVLDVSDFMPAS